MAAVWQRHPFIYGFGRCAQPSPSLSSLHALYSLNSYKAQMDLSPNAFARQSSLCLPLPIVPSVSPLASFTFFPLLLCPFWLILHFLFHSFSLLKVNHHSLQLALMPYRVLFGSQKCASARKQTHSSSTLTGHFFKVDSTAFLLCLLDKLS